MSFLGRNFNGCNGDDSVLWFIILFLLLFWGTGTGCCDN